MNAMDETIAGAFLERAQLASPKGSLSQAKGQRSKINFHHESYTTRRMLHWICYKLNLQSRYFYSDVYETSVATSLFFIFQLALLRILWGNKLGTTSVKTRIKKSPCATYCNWWNNWDWLIFRIR